MQIDRTLHYLRFAYFLCLFMISLHTKMAIECNRNLSLSHLNLNFVQLTVKFSHAQWQTAREREHARERTGRRNVLQPSLRVTAICPCIGLRASVCACLPVLSLSALSHSLSSAHSHSLTLSHTHTCQSCALLTLITSSPPAQKSALSAHSRSHTARIEKQNENSSRWQRVGSYFYIERALF